MGKSLRNRVLVGLLVLQATWFASCGGGGGTIAPPVQTISVIISPSSSTLFTGKTQQFSSSVTGTSNSAVTWSVNGIVSGNSAVGTITSAGTYTAPMAPPAPNTVSVKATSVADPTRSASASVTLVSPVPVLTSITPTTLNAGIGASTLVVRGTDFTPQSTVMLGATPLSTTFGGDTRLTALVPAAQSALAGSFPVTVVTPSPGGGTSTAVNLLLLVVVEVSPQAQSLEVGQTQQFVGKVEGSANQGIVWSVNGIAGGNSTIGTVDSSGLFTAPAIPPTPNSVSLTATSTVDTTRSDSASVTIVNPVPSLQSISPASILVGSANATLMVTGMGFTQQSLVRLGATSLTTSFGNSTQVSAVIPSAQLTATGLFPITVETPSPGGGTSSPKNLTVSQAPAITSASSATFTVGTGGSFTVTATGFPAPTLSETGALPSGVMFNTTTGVLSGTPGASAGGTYNISFKASNGVGTDSTQNFTLTVNQAPAITSAASTTFTVGTGGSFTVTATGFPAPTLSETGALPSVVTFNTSTGVLSGTPGASAGGTYNISFTASNGVGTNVTQNFTLTVENPAPVLFSLSPPGATAGDGNTTVTLTGTTYTGQSVVYSDATPLTTTYVSSTQIKGLMPASMLVSTGTPLITVVSPAPGGGTSGSLTFTIWPTYPRSGAGSVLIGPPPALKQITQTGTLVSVLDWTSKDNLPGSPEDVLAADHLLSEMGIPNTDTTDLTTAEANPFLVVAGVVNTSLLAAEVTSLTGYVNGGGNLYLWQPNDTNLLSALGLGTVTNHTGVVTRQLTFDLSKVDPLLTYIDASEEINWQPTFPQVDVTRGYSAGSCTPLATWITGDYAMLRCDIGTGHAYVFGWRLRPLLTLPERQLFDGPEPDSTNIPILDADICRLLMRGSYEGRAASPQVRQWAPRGHHATLIISHDVDAIVAYQNVPAWVDFEGSLGVKSTYFFTTNPYDTGYIAPMYTPSGIADIQYALAHGFDVEDHSLGHFPDFTVAPYSVGPPTEDASNYLPLFDNSTSECCTSGMSVIGEAGVSKWLLETDLGISVPSFRSGYLADPPDLIRGLSDIGYRRDSTYALGLTRGSFPFVTFGVDDTVTPNAVTTYHLMEYPVTISEDQVPVLDSTTINNYLNAWENLIRINYNNNAPTVLLIHPIDTGIRFQILQQLITDLQTEGLDLWIGDLKTYAEFWEAQGVTNAKWP
jgi:Putative Ig domain